MGQDCRYSHQLLQKMFTVLMPPTSGGGGGETTTLKMKAVGSSSMVPVHAIKAYWGSTGITPPTISSSTEQSPTCWYYLPNYMASKCWRPLNINQNSICSTTYAWFSMQFHHNLLVLPCETHRQMYRWTPASHPIHSVHAKTHMNTYHTCLRFLPNERVP
jgi:hypothetical protein